MLSFYNKFKPLIYSLVMAVILLLAIFQGLAAGQSLAQAQATADSARNFETALNFFYNDQDRFPTAVEFSDPAVMSLYLNNFPPPNFSPASCSQNYVYARPSDNSYRLDFCLAKAYSNFKAGWNVISGQK